MDIGQNSDERKTKRNKVEHSRMEWMSTVTDCDGTVKQSTSTSSAVMACKKKKIIFFLLLRGFFKFIIIFFFFQNYYEGYSLHDYKLKNTQECIAQMLTSKPMYKESKCMWGCITGCRSCIVIKPCVCVCVCACMLPRPKVGSKTSFGAIRSFLPSKLRNSERHGL
jgi:hypothetical protein